ncbi:MAG: glycosyl transferase family 2 [Clostridiaceae bacterium]|nr:glycosyl transferase family 2 [Clostridiaceae bacterium]
MHKLQVAVYAICKNESKHIKRWMQSVNEADGIFVLDTGSDDDSVQMLRNLGAAVRTAVITPWRFDTARNMSLDAVPQNFDICVCCDLDEVFTPGWRQGVESAWVPGCQQLRYPFVYQVEPNGEESFFYRNLIHSRKRFKWQYPIHETLLYTGKAALSTITTDNFKLYHYPDKEKPRLNYLPLLEAACAENPDNLRMLHYLGREYLYRRLYDKAVEQLSLHALICQWPEERSASLRYLGRSLEALGRTEDAEKAFIDAVKACPWIREPYAELSYNYYKHGKLGGCLDMSLGALAIATPSKQYLNEAFAWGSMLWDLASISAFKLGYTERAFFYAKKALELSPDDPRLLENIEMISKAMKLSPFNPL